MTGDLAGEPAASSAPQSGQVPVDAALK